jgi:nucleoside transporter
MATSPFRRRFLLCAMMFLQFAINGVWSIPLVAYLGKVGYTDTQIALAYTTLAWAAIVAPLFVGMIADRFFAAEKVLAVLNLLGGVFLYLASLTVVALDGTPRPVLFFWVLLAHCVCYMPTWSLTNSIALAHVRDAGKDFPLIRVMGTIGWIVVSAISLVASYCAWNIEETVWPMRIGAGLCIITGGYDFFLPHTPPQAAGAKVTISDVLGLNALGLLRDGNLAGLMACSFLIMIPASFYWTFCDGFLNEIQMKAVQFKLSIGQMSEMCFMFLLPFLIQRMSLKIMVFLGLLTWTARYVLFAFGNMGDLAWLLYLALAVHGIAFAFIFVIGPMYIDRKTPKALQASAQGLLMLVTFGLGQLLGTYFAGAFVDYYRIPGAASNAMQHSWRPIWLWAALMSAIVTVIFFASFRDKINITADLGEELALATTEES